uniref:hypothetical protein n=1 Tax=Gormaniella terricola TaxID=2904618 RepID=UPI0021CC5E82|nr:hypothetical protein ODF01_pgp064 [Gormaniella terricola]UWV18239.1 hypothetical protein [Gormaniella terricola]
MKNNFNPPTPPVRVIQGPGVYSIFCTKTNKIYYGATNDLITRFSGHTRRLKNGKHENKELQKDWTAYGWSAFIIEVLYYGPEFENNKTLLEKETSLINQSKYECYNISSNEKLRILNREQRRQERAESDLLVKYPLTINGLVYTSSRAAQRAFGVGKRKLYKKLHEAAKELGPNATNLIIDWDPVLSVKEANQTRKISVPYNPRIVYEGVQYLTISEAAIKCGVSRVKIARFLKDSTKHDSYYLNKDGSPIDKSHYAYRKPKKPTRFLIDGIVFHTAKEVAEHYHLVESTVFRRARGNNPLFKNWKILEE